MGVATHLLRNTVCPCPPSLTHTEVYRHHHHTNHIRIHFLILPAPYSVLVALVLHDHKSHLSEAPRPMGGSLGKQMSSSQAANSPQLAWCVIQGLSTVSSALDRAFWLVTPQNATQVTCCSGDLLPVSLENTAWAFSIL